MNMDWAPEILKRLTGSSHGLRAGEIEIGDSFIQVGMGPSVWVVERFCSPKACEIPHVVITREGTTAGSKIISAATLADASLYRMDRRSAVAENETDSRRRRTDPLLKH